MNKTGQVTLIGAVVAILVLSILIPIGLKISSSTANSIDRSSFTADQNTTYDNVLTTTSDSYELSTTGMTVLAAVGIIAALMGFARMVT